MCPPQSVSQLPKQPMKRVRFDMEETSSTSSSRNSSNKSISDTGSTLENDHSNESNQRPCRPQYPTTARSCSSFYPLSSRVAPIKRPSQIPGMLFSLTPLGSDNNSYHRWSGQEERSGNSKSTACAPSVPVRLPSMDHIPTSTISEILGSALAILGEEPYASTSTDNNDDDVVSSVVSSSASPKNARTGKFFS